MKKIIIVSAIAFSLTSQAATVRIYNKSNAPLQASVIYNDQGIPITILSAGIYREPKKMVVSHTIQPNSSAYFDSGLSAITQISFVPAGGAPFNFNPAIGSWEVERIVEYYNPTDIRRVR